MVDCGSWMWRTRHNSSALTSAIRRPQAPGFHYNCRCVTRVRDRRQHNDLTFIVNSNGDPVRFGQARNAI